MNSNHKKLPVKEKNRYKKGIIGTIVLIVIALIILGYFHISLHDIAQSAQVKENLQFVWNIVVQNVKSGITTLFNTLIGYINNVKK